MAFGQIAVTDSQGRGVTVTTPKSSTPQLIHSSPIEPETITIYNNIGSGFDPNDGWTEGGKDSYVGLVYQAMAFIPQATHYFARTDIAMGYVQGTNGLTLYLETDNSGVPSGKKLYTCKLKNLPVFGSTSTQVSTCKVPKSKKIKLTKNKRYWLVPLPNSDEWAAWNCNATGANGLGAFTKDGVTWKWQNYNPNGAFDVLGR